MWGYYDKDMAILHQHMPVQDNYQSQKGLCVISEL